LSEKGENAFHLCSREQASFAKILQKVIK
jgi:hypothetical protein